MKAIGQNLSPAPYRESARLFNLTAALLLLIGIGLTALYSASYEKALQLGLSGDYFFRRQVTFTLAGICAAFVGFMIPEKILRGSTPLLLAAGLALMVLTLGTGLGQTQLGARRWIQIGPVGFQPSEVVKGASILYLAAYFSRHRARIDRFLVLIPPAVVTGLFALLILLQRDFSTTVLFMLTAVALFASSGIPASYLAYLLALIGIPAVQFVFTEPYRIRRVVGFLFRDIDPGGINYQVNASLQAVMAGGFSGKGWGEGVFKLGRLPEVHSDFIFASFVEETGLFGGAAVILLFSAVALIGYGSAARLLRERPFPAFLGIGITSLITFQAFMNIGVVLGLFPPTGIPLPFFSQGGTSLTVNIAMAGLLCRVVHESRRYDRRGCTIEQMDRVGPEYGINRPEGIRGEVLLYE